MNAEFIKVPKVKVNADIEQVAAENIVYADSSCPWILETKKTSFTIKIHIFYITITMVH